MALEVDTSRSFGDSTVFAEPKAYEGKTFNPDLLAEQAAAAFGERYVNNDCPGRGMDARGMGLYLYPLKGVEPDPEADLKKWLEVIAAHNPEGRTADQEVEEAESAEKLALKDASENWGALDAETKDYMMMLTVQRAARQED